MSAALWARQARRDLKQSIRAGFWGRYWGQRHFSSRSATSVGRGSQRAKPLWKRDSDEGRATGHEPATAWTTIKTPPALQRWKAGLRRPEHPSVTRRYPWFLGTGSAPSPKLRAALEVRPPLRVRPAP
jgi:hypothetical protein